MRILCLTAIAGGLLAGCGQKGPLILPDHNARPTVGQPVPAAPRSAAPAAPAAPASAAPDDGSDADRPPTR